MVSRMRTHGTLIDTRTRPDAEHSCTAEHLSDITLIMAMRNRPYLGIAACGAHGHRLRRVTRIKGMRLGPYGVVHTEAI